jgi:hypothetical protein
MVVPFYFKHFYKCVIFFVRAKRRGFLLNKMPSEKGGPELLFQTASCSLDSTSSILRIMTDNDLRRICQLELWMQKSNAKNQDLLKNFPRDASQKGEEYRKENAI